MFYVPATVDYDLEAFKREVAEAAKDYRKPGRKQK